MTSKASAPTNTSATTAAAPPTDRGVPTHPTPREMEDAEYTRLPAGPTIHNTASIATENGVPAKNDLEEGELPTPFQLWRHIYGDLLFGNPLLRDLVYWDMALHLFCWMSFASMLWAFFLGYLPFNLAFKIYFFGLMGVFAVSTDVWGILLNAAILIRLRDKIQYPSFRMAVKAVFRSRRFSSLLAIAGASTGVRMMYITGNNIIPFCGMCVLPVLLKKCTVRRTGVAWMEQMDMSLTITINERCGYPTGRYRAIAYYKQRWGNEPHPLIHVNSVIMPPLLLVVFGFILPLLIVGKKRDNHEMMAAGFTASVFVFGFVQFMRPLAANIYAMAAYRYTEFGENEIFAQYPSLAPRAFRSLAKERDEKAAQKAAAAAAAAAVLAAEAAELGGGGGGKVDEDGWVHVEEGLGGAEVVNATNEIWDAKLARMQTLPLDSEDKKEDSGSDNGGLLRKEGGEEGRANPAEATSSASAQNV